MSEAALGQFDLETVLALGLGLAQRCFSRLAEGRFVCRFAGQCIFGVPRSPRFCSDATKGDAGTRDSTTGDREHHRCRDKRKFVRRSISQLQIQLLASDDWLRERYVSDQVAGPQNGFAVRRVARKKMKIAERNGARSFWPLHVYRRLQRRQSHAHVRRVGRNAMLTRAKNGERAIVTGNGWASGARLALVAWHGGVAEVDTTCALQQVSTNSSHIADLSRSALQYRLRQNRIILLHLRMICEIRIANGSSDLQSAIGHEFNLVERQAINI